MPHFSSTCTLLLAGYNPGMRIIETERLTLSRLTPDDAPFILELVNEPGWLRYIGDKGVHDMEGARGYIQNGPMDMYARLGFGLYRVELKTGGTPIGICGLIKRDTLQDVDIGFALLARFHGKGFALEAARATLEHARRDHGLTRVVAITAPDNQGSIRLLEKLGMRYQETLRLTPEGPESRFFVPQA